MKDIQILFATENIRQETECYLSNALQFLNQYANEHRDMDLIPELATLYLIVKLIKSNE